MNLWPLLERQFSRASHPLTGDALEAAKARSRCARSCRPRTSTCSRARRTSASRSAARACMIALIHRCLQCHDARAGQQLPVVRAGAAAHLARRARDLRVRARAQPAPHAASPATTAEATPERLYMQSLLLALANPYGFLPGQLADRAALPAGARALGEADRRRAGASHGQGGGDRSGRPRLPAVLGEQGRLDRRQQAVPADVRPRVPDPGAAARARSRRRRAGGHRPTTRPRGCSTSCCCGGCCGNGRFRRRASSIACRRARAWSCAPGLSGVWQYSRGVHAGVAQGAGRAAADDDLPGHQSHAGRLRAAPDRSGARGAAHRRADRAARRRARRPAGRDGALVPQHAEGQRRSSSAASSCPTRPRRPPPQPRTRADSALTPVVVLPDDEEAGPEASPPQLIAPAGAFALEQAVTLRRGNAIGLRGADQARRAGARVRAVRVRRRSAES